MFIHLFLAFFLGICHTSGLAEKNMKVCLVNIQNLHGFTHHLFRKYTDFIQKYVDVWILFMINTGGVLAFCCSPLVLACAVVGTIGSCNKKKTERLINVPNMKQDMKGIILYYIHLN